jgi:predicted permease
LTFGLLTGASLMIRSVLAINTIDLGVPAENMFVARLALPEADYVGAEEQRRFAADLLIRLETLPGAQATALTSAYPLQSGEFGPVDIEGRAAASGSDAVRAMVPVVSISYFEVFNAQPITGRNFTPADNAGSEPVAVVNRAFERRAFGDEAALGKRIRVGGEDAPWLTVVGVVPDLLESGIHNRSPQAVYRLLAQADMSYISIVVRTATNPLELTSAVRDQVRSIDADLPLYDINTLRGAVQDANWQTGIFGGLFAAFGSAALLLASVGLYGVMSFSVGQRRREVGVRMAIGARTRNVFSLILLQGMRQVAVGLGIGALLAFALSRGIESLLFGVSPQDPLAVIGTALLLVTVAVLACGVPALRAVRINPLDALRSE